MLGRRHQTGENHGTPFQISTTASAGPIRPGDLGRDRPGEHAVATPPTDHPVAVALGRVGGRPTAAEVRWTMSRPAAAHRRSNSSACTSEPPASSSSRSRHAKTCTRRTPWSTTSPTSRSISLPTSLDTSGDATDAGSNEG